MFCPKCGNQVADGAAFCNSCGAPMPGSRTATQTASPAANGVMADSATAQRPVAPAITALTAPEQVQVGADGIVHIDDEARPIKTTRNAIVTMLLRLITLGFYNFWFIYTIAKDTNTICSDDDEKTGGMLFFIIANILTLGIYGYYWEYKLANRLQRNASKFGAVAPSSGGFILLCELLNALCTLLNFIIPVIPLIGTLILGYLATNGIVSDINALAVGYNQRNGYPVPYSG